MSNDTECRTERRRAQVRAKRRNGIDGVEVSNDGRTLTLTFLGKAPPELDVENIRIDGGRRIRDIEVIDVEVVPQEDPALDDHVHVKVDRTGDQSTYTLSIVEPDQYGFPGTEPYEGFDPRYARAEFTFRQMCPTELDCKADTSAATAPQNQPVINYTARDYGALRKLLLDRMTLTVPKWTERHVPDLGVTLVELLAYVGDRLSYQQDAVATEAYLDTARKRVSVRRHVRLIDYAMHDGCNSRTFVTLESRGDVTLKEGDFRFVATDDSHGTEIPVVVPPEALAERPHEVFEPLGAGDVPLREAHNRIGFWTWGDEECVLKKGATSATLTDEWCDDHGSRALCLHPGDLLVIEEVAGPGTGAPADADPAHRQVVRLVTVTPGIDELYDQPIVEVTWEQEDALTFTACLSARGGQDCCLIRDITIARGNVVLVDHGRSLTWCDGEPEEIVVPPAEVVPPSCDPPEFGCPDGGPDDPGVALIDSLISKTAEREELTPEDVRDLAAQLGEPAPARAGILIDLDGDREIVLPDTAADQHLALRTLLAQVTYPAVRGRFRPVLEHAPVTQQVVFPLPADVARAQERLLATVPGRVRTRLDRLWRQVKGGTPLTRDQVAELTVLFGARTLAELDLDDRPLRALRELRARQDELLATKLRRLAVLRQRARSGGVLDDGVVWEIGQTWGEHYSEGLAPQSQGLRGSARSALVTDPRAALPAVTLHHDRRKWTPRRDLLLSGPQDRHFVGEVDNAGRLVLRFGDGRHGAAPPPGATLAARYRVGNGAAGNVGAEAINHLVLCCGEADVTRVRNPLVAQGGVDPESLNDVRELAPLTLRRELLRAVTPADYATLAAKVPGVQRAAALARWTGTGREIQVAVDPLGQTEPSERLLDAVAHALEPVRRIGHRVSVGPALLVPIELALLVCVADGYQRGHVLAAVKAALAAFFHPDALTFGEPVRVSRIVAAVAAVPGVVTARVTTLRRQFEADHGELDNGLLPLGPLEIAQLENDIDQPEHGLLTITMRGGR